MNEVVEYESIQLPDTLEDLTQFVLVGKAKLQAYMLKLQTVNKLSVAQEIRDQTLKEAQEISTALIAAEQRIGELLLTISKATTNHKNPDLENRGASNFKTKSETISDMGYSKDEASDYQCMAKNPKIVRKVIDEAIANGEVVTKTQVLKEIKAERDKIKTEMTDLKEERDYLQSQVEELQNAEPKVATKTVEKIPADYDYKKLYSPASAKNLIKLDNGSKGICAGMSLAAATVYTGYPSTPFWGNKSSLHDVEKLDFCNELDSSAIDFIKLAHTFQYSSFFQKDLNSNKCNLKGALVVVDTYVAPVTLQNDIDAENELEGMDD